MVWLIPFVMLAVVLAGTVALVLSLRRQGRIHAERQGRRIDQIAAQVAARFETPAVLNPRRGFDTFNRGHRIEALRLLRRGEGASHVAAALGLPRAEVELLIRVQGMAGNPGRAIRRP